MSSPSISVVIPSYNRRGLVCRTVRSLGACANPRPVEVIVVIDGSTDGSAEALARLDCPFPLTIIEQSNAGQAVARNRGAASASGELVLFLDDDMTPDRALIAEHVRMYESRIDAVTGESPLDPNSAPGVVNDALTKAALWPRDAPYSAFHLYSGNLSIRKCVFNELGGFDEQFCRGGYGGEDLDFGIRLLPRFKIVHNPAAIAWQHNVIGPRFHMKRARLLAQSDLRLMRKHPGIARDLLAIRGAAQRNRRSATIRLSALPILPDAAAFVAAGAAELARSTPFSSSRLLSKFYFGARSLAYWASFRKAAGPSTFARWLGA